RAVGDLIRPTGGDWARLSESSRQPRVRAPVAQRIEHLTTDQKVWGSNPYGRATRAGPGDISGARFVVTGPSWWALSQRRARAAGGDARRPTGRPRRRRARARSGRAGGTRR